MLIFPADRQHSAYLTASGFISLSIQFIWPGRGHEDGIFLLVWYHKGTF